MFTELKATAHWPLQTIKFGKPQTWGREIPEFKWDKYCVKPLENPGKYPVMENLYAFKPQPHALKFAAKGSVPLLEFHPSSGMKKPAKSAAQTLKRSFEKAVGVKKNEKDDEIVLPDTKKSRKE